MQPRQPITMRKVFTYAIVLFLAFGNAMSYHIFVFPNRFAPSGLNGLCTIVQEVAGITVGYLSLIINVPLALLVFRFVNLSWPCGPWSMWWSSRPCWWFWRRSI